VLKELDNFFNPVNITAGFSTSLAQAKIAIAEKPIGAIGFEPTT